MTTKPKGDQMAVKDAYEALVTFLKSVAEARSLADVNTAAGVALQDLGEEADVDE